MGMKSKKVYGSMRANKTLRLKDAAELATPLRYRPGKSQLDLPRQKKLRSRTWKMEGWNHKEALAVTAADFAQSVRVAASGKTIHFGAAFDKDGREIDGPKVKQRITLTIEDVL